MRERLSLVMSVMFVLALCNVSNALLLPADTTYNVPTGGTLVLDQTYGSNNDGKGSWVDPLGIITENSDSITINVNSNTATSGGVTYLPLPIPGLRGVDKVIDIGIVKWSTNNWPGARSATWRILDSYNNGYYVDVAVTPDPELGSQNVDGGMVWGWNGNGVKGKLPEYEVEVLRFSGKSWPISAFVSDDTTEVTSMGAWAGSNLGDIDMLRIFSLNNGVSSWEIGWIKVYSGVDPESYGAPLTAVPEPATMVLLGVGGLLLRRRK